MSHPQHYRKDCFFLTRDDFLVGSGVAVVVVVVVVAGDGVGVFNFWY